MISIPMTIVILTPLPVEYRAVRQHLTGLQANMLERNLYESGQFKGLHHTYKVIIRETGSKNNVVALAAERAIQQFKPSLIFLTGIAGGVKDVQIGDVVVGTKAYGYESGKETTDGPVSRPDVLPYDTALIETARLVSRGDTWRQRVPDGAANAKVIFGPIASGDKVIATSDLSLYRYLKLHYNDTTALEMESIGFATAVSGNVNLKALNVRGISDLLDHKSSDHQQMASERAAAFLFELLYQLNLKDFTEKPSSEKNESQVVIRDAKNVIVGSNISVGGDFNLGDLKINTRVPEEGNTEATQTNNIKSTLQTIVAKGRITDAVQRMVELTATYAPEIRQEVVMLSDRWEQLAKKNRMGIISNTEATLERNQITASLLELIEKLSR